MLTLTSPSCRESPIPPSHVSIGSQEDDGCDQKKEDEGAPHTSAACNLLKHPSHLFQRGALPRHRTQTAQQAVQTPPKASASDLQCAATAAARHPTLAHLHAVNSLASSIHLGLPLLYTCFNLFMIEGSNDKQYCILDVHIRQLTLYVNFSISHCTVH